MQPTLLTMEHRTGRPKLADLRSSIASYSQITGSGALSKTIPPATGAVLLLNLQGRYQIDGCAVPDTALVGIREIPWELRRDASVTDRIFIQFAPAGLSRFTPRAANSLANGIEHAEQVLPPGALRRLVAALSETRSFDDRTTILDQFFQGCYSPVRNLDEDVERLAARLCSGIPDSLAGLLEEIPASPRHIERLFARRVGLSPQALGRITRFNRARNAVLARDMRTLTDIGLEAGYYDQSHFTREFKRLSSQTPGAYSACSAASSFAAQSSAETH